MDSSGFHEHQAPGSGSGCAGRLPLRCGRLRWNIPSQYWYALCCPLIPASVCPAPGSPSCPPMAVEYLSDRFVEFFFSSLNIILPYNNSLSRLVSPYYLIVCHVFTFSVLHLAVCPKYMDLIVCLAFASIFFFKFLQQPFLL